MNMSTIFYVSRLIFYFYMSLSLKDDNWVKNKDLPSFGKKYERHNQRNMYIKHRAGKNKRNRARSGEFYQ